MNKTSSEQNSVSRLCCKASQTHTTLARKKSSPARPRSPRRHTTCTELGLAFLLSPPRPRIPPPPTKPLPVARSLYTAERCVRTRRKGQTPLPRPQTRTPPPLLSTGYPLVTATATARPPPLRPAPTHASNAPTMCVRGGGRGGAASAAEGARMRPCGRGGWARRLAVRKAALH